jgi:ABC-type sugar transport system ATPase subunit
VGRLTAAGTQAVAHDITGASVSLRGVSKHFGATQALVDVDLDIEAGTIHALVGENGAGKSTLGKIVGGIYTCGTGTLSIDGEQVGRWDPPSALRSGIATIQQELSLVPALTVAQNVFLGMEPSRFGRLTKGMAERYRALDDQVGFGLDPDVQVRSLRLADQQKVEILRAIARQARLIVMDEPTSSLTQDEADRLHEIMVRLRDERRTIIYVSHFLEDVLRWADVVTVMRDGRVVRTAPTAQETSDTLVEGMLGRTLATAFPDRVTVDPDAPVVFEAAGVSGDLPHDIDMVVRRGEIVGLAGLLGSGRTELARLIFGADPLRAGELRLHGRPLSALDPRTAIDLGIAMLPEDRRGLGLVMTRNVRENITLAHMSQYSRAGRVSRAAERAAARDMIDRLDITPARVDGDLQVFSGGNQQKALFGKWTIARPDLIVLDEPTRGVDVGAKRRIYDAIIDVARAGSAVILISSELEEVVELSHRIYLIEHGRITGEVEAARHSADDLLRRLFGTDAGGSS